MGTLTIDLDDQASAGLDEVIAALDKTALASEWAAKGADVLTESQKKQFVILQQQEKAYVALGRAALAVYGDIAVATATAGIKAFGSFEESLVKAGVATERELIRAGASIAKWGIGSATAAYVATKAINAHTENVRINAHATDDAAESQDKFTSATGRTLQVLGLAGAASTTLAARYGLLGAVAEQTSKKAGLAVVGMGGFALGAGLAVKSLEAAWDRTGKKFEEFSYSTDKSTKEQIKAFDELKASAKELGVEFEVLASSKGLNLEKDFGVEKTEVYSTNLTRINKAFKDLGSEVGGTLKDDLFGVGGALKQQAADAAAWALGVDELGDVWKAFDKDMTMRADNLVENLGHVKTGFRSLHDTVSDFFTGDGGGSARLREMKEFKDAQEKLTAEIQDDLARVKIFNAQAEKADTDRAEGARLNSLKTRDAIVGELQAMDVRRAKMAAENGFTEAAAKQMMSVRENLKNRLMALDQKEAEQRAKYHAVFIDQSDEELDAITKRLKHSQELFDLETRHRAEFANLQKGLNKTQKQQDADTEFAAAKDNHEAQKDMTSERLKAQGATEAQIKIQLAAMDKQFSAAEHQVKTKQIEDEARDRLKAIFDERDIVEKTIGDDAERKKTLIKLQMEEEKARADRIKRQVEENGRFDREQNKLTHGQKMAAQQALWNEDKANIEKKKQLEQEATRKAMQGFDGAGFMDAQDPRKVRSQFQADQMAAAKKAQQERDQDMGQKAMGGDQQALRQFAENQRRAMQRAKKQAGDDFDSGNVDQGQLAKAQGQVAQQTIQTLGAQGQLSQQLVQSLTENVKNLADEQQSIANLSQSVSKIIAFQKGQKTIAQQQVTTTQNQQGSLGL